MSDIGSVLSRISLEFVGDVIRVVFTIQEHVLLLDVGNFQSGLLQHHDNLSLVDLVLFSQVDNLCWSWFWHLFYYYIDNLIFVWLMKTNYLNFWIPIYDVPNMKKANN